jgi:hypothetical protein
VKKILVTAAAGLAMIAAPIAASAHPSHNGGNAGAAVAAGALGFILGAALTSSQHQDYAPAYDNGPAYGYGQPYYAPADYGDRCFWRTQAYRTHWGRIQYRQVEVCR